VERAPALIQRVRQAFDALESPVRRWHSYCHGETKEDRPPCPPNAQTLRARRGRGWPDLEPAIEKTS